MTSDDFEKIKQKMEEAKTKKAKAEGALERINTTLKTDFGITSAEEIPGKLEEMENEINTNQTHLNKLYTQLEGLTDWALI